VSVGELRVMAARRKPFREVSRGQGWERDLVRVALNEARHMGVGGVDVAEVLRDPCH